MVAWPGLNALLVQPQVLVTNVVASHGKAAAHWNALLVGDAHSPESRKCNLRLLIFSTRSMSIARSQNFNFRIGKNRVQSQPPQQGSGAKLGQNWQSLV